MIEKGLVEINEEKYNSVLYAYTLWKKFDEVMREISSRGVNLHEGISEVVVCYVNDFYHSIGRGSEDAETRNHLKVQVKASSNFDDDLTSFGPTSEFDFLHFARLHRESDKLYLYDIPLNTLYDIKVNEKETFKDKQNNGQRPRFSIIKNFLKDAKPYAIVNMINGEITR